MCNDRAPVERLTALVSTGQFLTVNMVMPTVGDNAEHGAGFARLLFGLTALALERFGAAQANNCPDSMRESFHPCLAGGPVELFDGQLLRFRKADRGYQFHSIGAALTEAPDRKDDLALTVVGSPQVSRPEGAHIQAACSP